VVTTAAGCLLRLLRAVLLPGVLSAAVPLLSTGVLLLLATSIGGRATGVFSTVDELLVSAPSTNIYLSISVRYNTILTAGSGYFGRSARVSNSALERCFDFRTA
jgi:hypothetical protein